jgi:hypothetical protein
MNDLVERLCTGRHPVVAGIGKEQTVAALKEAIDRGYVHVTFTGTRGGTVLGLALDTERSRLADANFSTGSGRATLVGELTLDYVKVRCVADIELPSLAGEGHLERVAES